MFQGKFEDLIKTAQEVSKNLSEQKDKLAKKRVEVAVGGGMVTITFNGTMEAISLSIDPMVVDPNDVGTLQDLILSAVNEGIKKCQKEFQNELGLKLGNLGDMKFPDL